MNPSPAVQRLVLIGAGHTNLQVVRMWRQRPMIGVSLTLVSAFDRATYSGMLPGTLAGLYRPAEMQIQLRPLARACGVHLIVDRVTGFDSMQREIHLEKRPPLRFDMASIGIGSIPSQRELWQGRTGVLSLKPMATLLKRLEPRIDNRVTTDPSAGGTERFTIVIVGAGAAGIEMAFCLDERLRKQGLSRKILLVDAHEEVLRGYPPRAVRLAHREMTRRGIVFHPHHRVSGCDEATSGSEAAVILAFDNKAKMSADLVIWTTGADPPPVLKQFDLPKLSNGFLAVRPTLQSTANLPVFIVGDTAGFGEVALPKAGVHAVREGPILSHNLRALAAGRPLKAYRPQSKFLSLLSTGDGRAIMESHGFTCHTRWAGWLKDQIDRRFMARFQVSGPGSPS